MNKNRAERLIQILKRLNAGEELEKVKKEAQEFLAEVEPAELASAEQQLVEAGLAPEDLRNLCAAHIEMFEDELKKVKSELEPGHIVRILISEHEEILSFLDELEKVNQAIQQMENYDRQKQEFKKLTHIAEHLVEAESHHQREEDVLFPEVEKRGVFGPPQIMRMEHEELRTRKKELKELAETVDQLNFNTFKKRLDTVAKFLVLTLRDHIFKENNILYPTALKVIGEDNEIWDKLRAECDEIGYCCFTPEVREQGGK